MLPESNLQGAEGKKDRLKERKWDVGMKREYRKARDENERESEQSPLQEGVLLVFCLCWGGCTLTCANIA